MNLKMKKKNEFNYFDEFAKFMEIAKQEILEVKNYISNFDYNNSEEKMKVVHQLENKGDEKLHDIKNFLLKDFLPPIDREDILEIANKIDDLIDGIDEIVININILNIAKIETQMIEMINLLEFSINQVYDIIILFKNFKNFDSIKEKVIEQNGIEESADRMYENAIRELYSKEQDAIKISKYTKIYERIEECFDICECIANIVEETLMKNG